MNQTVRKANTKELFAIWPIAAAVLAGFVLRLYDIERIPLWYDEVIHLEYCRELRFDLLFGATEIVEPFFSVLLYFIQRIGTADWWVRMHSVVTGALVPVAGYCLARRIGGPRAGIFAAVLLAFSPLLVFYSRDAKEYALLALLQLGLLALTQRYRESTGARGTLALYIAVATASVYTHILAPLFLTALNLTYFAVGPRKGRHFLEWLAAQAVVVVFSIPFILAQLRFLRAMELKFFWPPKPNALSVVTSLENFIVGYAVHDAVRYVGLAIGVVAVGWLLVKAPVARRSTLLLLGTAAGQIAILFIVSRMGVNSYYVDRFLIGSGMAVLTAVAIGLAHLPRPVWQYGLTSLLVLAMSNTLYNVYQNQHAPNWLKHVGVYSAYDGRGMARHLQTHHQPGDTVWHLDHHLFVPIRWYSPELDHQRIDMGGRMRGAESLRAAASAENIGAPYRELEAAAEGAQRIWVVFPGDEVNLSSGDRGYLAWLEARGDRAASYVSGGDGTRFPKASMLCFDLVPDAANPAQRSEAAIPATAPRGELRSVDMEVVTARISQVNDVAHEGAAAEYQIAFQTTSPYPQTVHYDVVYGERVVVAAQFERQLGDLSTWRLQAFRDRDVQRMAMQTRVERDSGSDELRYSADAPPGWYDIFIERVIHGSHYPAPAAELAVNVFGHEGIVPGAAPQFPRGGWTWLYSGRVLVQPDTRQSLTVAAVNTGLQPEAHAAFSRILFVRTAEHEAPLSLSAVVHTSRFLVEAGRPVTMMIPAAAHPGLHAHIANTLGSVYLRLPDLPVQD